MMARWYVDLIGRRLHRMGTIVADTENQAIEAAINQLEIERARQDEITVTKISGKDHD